MTRVLVGSSPHHSRNAVVKLRIICCSADLTTLPAPRSVQWKVCPMSRSADFYCRFKVNFRLISNRPSCLERAIKTRSVRWGPDDDVTTPSTSQGLAVGAVAFQLTGDSKKRVQIRWMPRQCSPACLALDGNDAIARRSTPPIRRHCSMKSESGRTGICQGESSSDHTRLGTKDAPSLLDAASDDPSIPPTEAREGTSHFPAPRTRPFGCSFDANRPKQRRTQPSAAHPFPSCRIRNPLFRSDCSASGCQIHRLRHLSTTSGTNCCF